MSVPNLPINRLNPFGQEIDQLQTEVNQLQLDVSSAFGLSLEAVLQNGNSAGGLHLADVSNIFFSAGGNYNDNTAIISNDITTLFFEVNSLDTSVNILANPLMGQYYKNTSQAAGTGQTSLTWSNYTSWTDLTAITQGATDHFQVNVSGLYFLEANMSCDSSGSTWGASNKIFVINITRGTSNAVFVDTRFVVSATNWGQFVNGTYDLYPGDIIHIRLSQTLTSGTSSIRGSSGMDLNTFFTWRLIKTLP